MNLWHDIAPGSTEKLTVVVEIPRGSNNKYEIDKETGLIALDRVLHSAQTFPFDYGFVPQTLWHDGDALDVILLATNPFPSGILVHARPIAVMRMMDSGDNDDKLIAVPTDDPRWNDVLDLNDINSHTIKEIDHFYSTYKILQKKEVKVTGFEGKEAAAKVLAEGIALYTAKFGKS